MNKFVFNKSLNGVCREYLVVGGTWPEPNPYKIQIEMARVTRSVGELLLCHEGVAFQVLGESIPVAVLLSVFGLKGLEALIEQKALEFVLWTPLVTYAVTDVKGVYPLATGNYESKINTDPEESITAGLKWAKPQVDEKTKKDLIKKLRGLYKLPPKDFSSKSAEFGHQGYRNNLFERLGLPNTKPLEELVLSERKKLGLLATESLEMSTIAHFGYGTVDEYNLQVICEKEYEVISKNKDIPQRTKTIFKLENVPAFSELIRTDAIKLTDIPLHRARKDAVKFREMVRSIGVDSDSAEFSREYIDLITKPGFFEEGKGKYLKAITVSSLFGAVGGFLGGGEGAATGAVLGGFAHPVIDSSLGILDSVYLDGLLKGWNPRSYIHGLKKNG